MKQLISVSTQQASYTCDLCGNPTRHYACKMCGTDLCPSCGIFDPRELGDYPYMFCKPCWGVGESFRAEELAEHDRHDAAMDDIEQRWRAECANAGALSGS